MLPCFRSLRRIQLRGLRGQTRTAGQKLEAAATVRGGKVFNPDQGVLVPRELDCVGSGVPEGAQEMVE